MSLTDCWIAAHALRAALLSCAHAAGELIPSPNAARSPKTKFVLNFTSCAFTTEFTDVLDAGLTLIHSSSRFKRYRVTYPSHNSVVSAIFILRSDLVGDDCITGTVNSEVPPVTTLMAEVQKKMIASQMTVISRREKADDKSDCGL